MSPARRWLARLGLLAVGLLLALLAAEGLARFAVRDAQGLRQSLPPMNMFQTTDLGLLIPTPGFEGHYIMPGSRVELAFDARGLRGEPQAGGGPGWLLIGDSFTLAAQVQEHQTFRAGLERALGVPVYNAGVDNYSISEAAWRYRTLADELPLSSVLLTICLDNDLWDNHAWSERTQAGAPPLSFVDMDHGDHAVLRLFFQHSVLRALAAQRLELRSTGREAVAGDRPGVSQNLIYTKHGQEMIRQLMPATRAALEELQQETVARGHRLLVGLAPELIQIHPPALEATFAHEGLDPADADPLAPNRAFAAVLDELGIASCDPTESLRRALQGGERPYLRWDGHWSAQGHATYTQTLLACLERATP